MDEAWPPDWRSLEADSCEARVIHLGTILAALEELEQLLPGDEEIVTASRMLGGRVKTRRNELRDRAGEYRAAVRELV